MRRRLLIFFLAAGFVLAVGAARAGDGLTQIQNRGTLVIGTDATYPPFELLTGDTFTGFDIDLGNEIGRELGVKVQWQNIAWDGIFTALQTKKFDLVISDVVITDKRKKEMSFSQPYFLSGQTIARRKGDTRISTSKDLPGKLVTVQQETTGQYAAEKLGPPKPQIRKFETMQDALLEVRNGRGDAAVGDEPALTAMLRKGYPELELVGGVFVHENYAVVVRKGEPELLLAVNRALDKIVSDGRYAKIYQKHIGKPLPAGYLPELARVKRQGTPTTGAGNGGGSAFTLRWPLLKAALPLLLRGAVLTVELTALGLLFGIPLGLLLALARLSRLRLLQWPAVAYVEVVRGTPLLAQIYVIYFVLPAVGLQLPQFVSAVLALSLNAGAYISEIFRAGIESIDTGQMEAARALGMDYKSAMRWVILPQTLRRVLPPLTNEGVALLKDSSLISIIGLAELTRVGREQASNAGSPVTIFLAVAAIYLLMTLPLTYLVRRLETRLQWTRRPRAAKAKVPAV